MFETRPINQQNRLKDEHEFGRTLSNPTNRWDLCPLGRETLDNSQEPSSISRRIRRTRVP